MGLLNDSRNNMLASLLMGNSGLGVAQGGNPLAKALDDPIYKRNKLYAFAPSAMTSSYLTNLNPLEEMAFQQWVKKNNVPFDPAPTADYDMRGFYKALMTGDPRAKTGMNANDGQMHFTDFFKTPYHESFSAESRYAAPGAPSWNELDQLVTPGGKIVFDERNRR